MADHPVHIAAATPEGVSLEEAIKRWCDPVAVSEMLRLSAEGCSSGPMAFWVGNPETEYQRKTSRYLSLRGELKKELIAKLTGGMLVATGYDSRAPIDAPPVTIPANRWRVQTPNLSASSAMLGEVTITDIRVFQQEPAKTGAPGRPSSMHLIKLEFERRRAAGQLLDTLTAESEYLSSWLTNAHPQEKGTTAKTIANCLRKDYREAKEKCP